METSEKTRIYEL